MKPSRVIVVLFLSLFAAAGVFVGGLWAGGLWAGGDGKASQGETGGDEGAGDRKIVVVFAGTEGSSAGQSRMMMDAAEQLNATGRFDAKVYVNGSLPGGTDNLVTQARLGANLVIPSDPGRLASQFNIPDLNILMAPYILADYRLLEKLPQSGLYKEWQTALEAQGIVLIANMFNGFRSFYTTTPVTTVADLSGLRIRGFGDDIGQALAKYLGYVQTAVGATEIYAGIQSGTLDGCEIQAAAADSYRLYDVVKCLARTNHYMLQSSFVCGKILLESMPQAEREFFVKTVSDTAAKYAAIIADQEAGYYDSFRAKGITVVDVNQKDFEAAIAPLYTNNDLKMSTGIKDRLFRELGL
ncbi:MAG: TRAP transporter substrate-binding protein DctP [Treponema sp.]|jgi:TRAP-type C4-dicarboxylate transport system substrate-binding protein|nr:TRAP transporter substrate-binding protein DctP [Treponema sp.]